MLEFVAACAVAGICVLAVVTTPRLRNCVTAQMLRSITPKTVPRGISLGVTSVALALILCLLIPWVAESHGLLDWADGSLGALNDALNEHKYAGFLFNLVAIVFLTIVYPRAVLELEVTRYHYTRAAFTISSWAAVLAGVVVGLLFVFVLGLAPVVMLVIGFQWAVLGFFAPSFARDSDGGIGGSPQPGSRRRSAALSVSLAELPGPWRAGALQSAATLVVAAWLALAVDSVLLYLAKS